MSSVEKERPGKVKQVIISNESEHDRLMRDIYRPDMEKFKLFMQMLRNNTAYKDVKITHK